jgi:hypothetical protein
LNVVIHGSQCIGGVVGWSLFLLLWPLLILGSCAPGSQSELTLVLPKRIVEWSWVWQPSSGSDKFDHLSPLCDVNGFFFVFTVSHGEWAPNDFVQDAWGESVHEEAYGLLIANGITGLAYQIFEI